MQERRKEARKSLMAYTQVFDLYGGVLLGYLGDLTMKGAMVIGDKALVEDSKLTLAIELPELEGVKASRIIFPARVVWCDQDISPDYFNIGFELLDVKPEQKPIVQAIIQKYEFQRDMPNYTIKPSANPKG
jgi:hypothetical protein